ncbi:MAG: methylated-DNA--[protein]-cysteine S-methyltransferase [Desulfovibrio sp.]|nr:methylated-DNA--[protein]-cysteine S-methyltransferase [Desulfovibrio sp.]
MDYTSHYESPLGGITLASDGNSLVGLWFAQQKYFAETLALNNQRKHLPVFQMAREWLTIYFSGKDPGFTPPLCLRTTAFRKEVWTVMLTIPFGQTMTYGEIASRIATQRGRKTMSAQAIGNAVAHNAISLIIPCHRVIGSNGSLTGYAAGINKKIELLKLEGLSHLFSSQSRAQ